MLRIAITVAFTVALVPACINGVDDKTEEQALQRQKDEALTSAQKQARSSDIISVAVGRGITDPVVIAGIANHESGLAQCWSEATWACQGPYSDSCNGPVIAGSGDGACSLHQGGLGMFQLDAGTYSQTLSTYGADVVNTAGNTNAGVDIIIQKVWHCPNTPHYDNADQVVSWINNAYPGGPNYEEYLTAMAWCYNGCGPSCSNHQQMRQNYRNGIESLLNAFGNSFWTPSSPPPPPSSSPPPAPAPSHPPAGCGNANAGTTFDPGQSLQSCDGRFNFVHQTDGNVVLYMGSHALWASHTNGDDSRTLVMQSDGNLVLYGPNNALWATGTDGHAGAHLAVQNDGNVVIYSANNAPLWATNTVQSSSPPPAPACAHVKVDVGAGSTLNVRPAPNTSQAPIGTLDDGAVVTRLGTVTGQSVNGVSKWFKIQQSSMVGFISGAYSTCAD